MCVSIGEAFMDLKSLTQDKKPRVRRKTRINWHHDEQYPENSYSHLRITSHPPKLFRKKTENPRCTTRHYSQRQSRHSPFAFNMVETRLDMLFEWVPDSCMRGIVGMDNHSRHQHNVRRMIRIPLSKILRNEGDE